MGEFGSRNNTEPFDEEFANKLQTETNPQILDELIETKAKEILAELKEEERLKKESIETSSSIKEEVIPEESHTPPKYSISNNTDTSEQNPNTDDFTDSVYVLYELITNEPNQQEIQTLSDLIKVCQSKIDHADQEIHSNQRLISLHQNQSGTARDKTQVQKMIKKTEELEIEKETFETLMELSLYNSEIELNLDEVPIDKLISRHRIYQTFIYKYNISNDKPIIPYLKSIEEQYHTQILHLIESGHIDEKYGLGSATGKPLSIQQLEKFLVPDTEAEGFWKYQDRKAADERGTERFLRDGQIQQAVDDTVGRKSEEFVVKELIQIPGVLMTIDMPKFSVGDTQYKADTIVITLDPEFELSVTDDYIQKAVYQLLWKFGAIVRKHNDEYKDISGIDPHSPIIHDIVHINPSIKFNSTNTIKDSEIPIHNILRMHRVQIKTKSDSMSSALEDYKKSPYTKEPNDIGLLSKEYKPDGQSLPQPFNRTDFQIAAQTILGLPIR